MSAQAARGDVEVQGEPQLVPLDIGLGSPARGHGVEDAIAASGRVGLTCGAITGQPSPALLPPSFPAGGTNQHRLPKAASSPHPALPSCTFGTPARRTPFETERSRSSSGASTNPAAPTRATGRRWALLVDEATQTQLLQHRLSARLAVRAEVSASSHSSGQTQPSHDAYLRPSDVGGYDAVCGRIEAHVPPARQNDTTAPGAERPGAGTPSTRSGARRAPT
eukprot:scaffold262511_cov28-Tisochrysis_lutea.AAC.3